MSKEATPEDKVILSAAVIAAELAEINQQRIARGLPKLTSVSDCVGLAISGGGIRSATFGLGVLQELREMKLLEHVDYLSTVSGGGYLGGWFTANRLRHPCEKSDAFLEDNHESVRHLRRFSRYLTPRTGLLSADTWTGVAIWLRNTGAVQFLLLIFLMLALLVPHVAPHLFEWLRTSSLKMVFVGHLVVLVIAGFLSWRSLAEIKKGSASKLQNTNGEMAVILSVMLGGSLSAAMIWGWITTNVQPGYAWDKPTVLIVSVLMAVLAVLTRLLCRKKRSISHGFISLIIQGFCVGVLTLLATQVLAEMFTLVYQNCMAYKYVADMSGADIAVVYEKARQNSLEWLSIGGTSAIVFSYSVIIGAGISLAGADMPDQFREWWARIGAWLFIISFSILFLGTVSLQGPDLVAAIIPDLGQRLSALLTWGGLTSLGMKLAGGANTSGTGGTPRWKELVVMLTPLVFFTGLLLAVACLVDGLLHLIQKTDMPAAYFSALGPYGDIFILGLVLLTILCVLLSHFDINELSMNQFYRNRLMRCYLGASRPQNVRKPQAFTGFDFADDAPLSHFGTAVTGTFSGPFWIVNTALNTAKNPDLDVAERRAESFILTPLYCGFERKGYGAGGGDLTINQGYRPTAEYLGGSMNAGQAVSISGAAASPNSGYHTSPLVAFMLTVFNARLGWWAANPVSAQDWKLASAPWRRSIAWYVLKELFGSASAADPYIYLSDGGHFENLGLYELVRRRTGLIIVSDAEEDGNYTFHALGTAIRRCWIDFQVKIEISASTIMPKEPGGISSAHCEIGKIYYPDQTVGTLIYMKSSWSGDEPTDLQQYRSANSAFPHESTGDQFFSESQFESYRKLGRHVAREGLSSTLAHLEKTPWAAAALPAALAEALHRQSLSTADSAA